MRPDTANTASKKGTQSRTDQSREYWYAAPATVAVSTSAGSTSEAPVTMPGIMRRSGPAGRGGWPSLPSFGQRTTFSPLSPIRLWDFGEFTMEGSSDPAFVPEAEWSRVVDDAKSRNRRQQKGRAQKKEDVGCSCFRNAQEN